MKVWVLIHQYAADGDAGYVAGVFATEDAANAARDDCVRDFLGEGKVPYLDPETGVTNDDWDEDYVVEEHEVQT